LKTIPLCPVHPLNRQYRAYLHGCKQIQEAAASYRLTAQNSYRESRFITSFLGTNFARLGNR